METDKRRVQRSGQANYGLAKAGVVGLTKVIAKVRPYLFPSPPPIHPPY